MMRSSPSVFRVFRVRTPVACFSTAQVDSKKLTITRTTSPKVKPPKETLKFGHTMSDHMLECDWDAQSGWHAPKIIPYGNLSIDPAASGLHYGLQCFEGMKAYVDESDQLRMFRPMMNMQRMNRSLKRLCMPAFDGSEYLECIKQLVKTDRDWIPKGWGYSLYLRPTAVSTYGVLGVSAPQSIKLYTISSPVGPYYASGFAPVKLLADPRYVRAWPGGTGNCKVGGNYAMGIGPAREAAEKGFAQILWLYGDNHQVTEVGTMNQFWFWKTKSGEMELITAPLDGTILEGVTRDSILQLTRAWGEFKVTERSYTISEIIAAVEEGRMIEAFGAGTAAIVSPVEGFQFNGKDYVVPLDASKPQARVGPLTSRLADTLMGIQYGKISHGDWSVIVK